MITVGGPPPGPFIGIDVGENFLDLAIVGTPPRTLVFNRVALDGLKEPVCVMLAERIGVPAFESYPDLQLRLSSPSTVLPPKRRRADALAARRDIVASLAARLRLRDAPVPKTLDQADAAALALAAAASTLGDTLWVVRHPCEGRFMLALDRRQARRLGIGGA